MQTHHTHTRTHKHISKSSRKHGRVVVDGPLDHDQGAMKWPQKLSRHLGVLLAQREKWSVDQKRKQRAFDMPPRLDCWGTSFNGWLSLLLFIYILATWERPVPCLQIFHLFLGAFTTNTHCRHPVWHQLWHPFPNWEAAPVYCLAQILC